MTERSLLVDIMPWIYDYHCTNETCGLAGPSGWGYYMYAEADDGERITCPHPGEQAKAREVIGEDATEEEMDSRTGFNYHCVCIDCVEQFERDPQRDQLRCPNCGSTAIELLVELVGHPCPKCGDGDFIAEDTGAIA